MARGPRDRRAGRDRPRAARLADPDGLERVAEDNGLPRARAQDAPFAILIPDYAVPGVDDPAVRRSSPGCIGVVVVFALMAAGPPPPTAPVRLTAGRRPLELDRYVARDSPLHRADARLKFVATIAFILAISLLPVGAFAGARRSRGWP